MEKNKKIVIIKDTRESVRNIYTFKQYPDVLLLRNNLTCGDFSIAGYTNQIFVERKQLDEIVNNFCQDRERWEGEWRRAVQVGYTHKYLMIEGNLQDLLNGNYRSAAYPNSIIASIMSWSLKYQFSWFMTSDMHTGEICVYWLMREYQRLQKIGELT